MSVPNTFSSGTPAVAAEVNDNFSAVKVAVDDNNSRIKALESALSALQSTVTLQADSITTLNNRLSATNNAISILQSSLVLKANVTHGHAQTDISGLISLLSTHNSQISAINNSNVMDLDAYLTISTTGVAKATLSGINLQIVNGMGNTSTINGLGNLIIGYDEITTFNSSPYYACSDGAYDDQLTCETNGQIWNNSHKTGSHYLVLGRENSYSQYGGLVAGVRNIVNREYSTVTGGAVNRASGIMSSVSGGSRNTASGYRNSVSGGFNNTASGSYSSVSGGSNHTSSGNFDWRAGSLFESQ